MNTKRITCPCGCEINFTSLNSHVKTMKHDRLFKYHCFPKPDSFFKKLEELDNISESIKEDEYIKKSTEYMKKYNYWKSEISNTTRRWYYLGKNGNTVKIGYRNFANNMVIIQIIVN
jgi:hypothetical protein